MELLLRRPVFFADLIGIAIGAAFMGHAVATVIAARLPPLPSLPRHSRPVAAAPVPAPDKPIDAIIGRNVFCVSARPEAPEPAPRRRALSLLAIMFAPPPTDSRWSLAIVRDLESATTGAYAVGARLGDATIVAIEDVRVVLDLGHGRRELLELLHPPAGSPSGPRSAATLDDGVRKTGTNSYEIRRAIIDQVLAGGLARLPRVLPQVRDGQPVGLRLAGVKGGPLEAIGLAEGDVLLEVDGRSIASPDAALVAYAALRTANHLSLKVERAGQRSRIEYLIR
jgi:general secretion pathway protein C